MNFDHFKSTGTPRIPRLASCEQAILPSRMMMESMWLQIKEFEFCTIQMTTATDRTLRSFPIHLVFGR
jgi:hypothetical protein